MENSEDDHLESAAGGNGSSEGVQSPRRSRQVSVDSAGISNDSEEETDPTLRVSSTDDNPTSLSSLLLGGARSTTTTTISGNGVLPHQRKIQTFRPSPRCKEGFKKSRTSFTKPQIEKLEVKFGEQKYLTKLDRTQLAREVGLTEKHVKTWFQNRRTKWKKDCSDADWSKHKEFAAALMYGQYLETKNGRSKEAGGEGGGEGGDGIREREEEEEEEDMECGRDDKINDMRS